MQRYKLISLDMFQTLVDVNTQKEAVMQAVLGAGYSAEKGECLWNDANRFVFSYFHRLQQSTDGFVTVLKIFEQCYAELLPKYNASLDPGAGARVLAQAHGRSQFYADSLPFMERVQQSYRTCLISDADLPMVAEILEKLKFERVFVSEQYRAYKFDPGGTLFRAAMQAFEIEPGEMLHIGDGYSDIAGAKRAGADAAWINRHGLEWKYEIRPDYVVTSLLELLPNLQPGSILERP